MSLPRPNSDAQHRNPLHGLTLEAIVTALVAHYGWAGLGERVGVDLPSSPGAAGRVHPLMAGSGC